MSPRMTSALILRRALEFVGYGLASVGKRVCTLPIEREHARYLAAGGDLALRLDYPLNPDSVVVDLGGYEGQWASDIHGKFGCVVHVFEPVPEFAAAIAERFRQNPRITVHDCGLGGADADINIFLDANKSSAYARGPARAVLAKIFAADLYIHRLGVGSIDLLKINIEGGEYDLLDHLIDTGRIKSVRFLQVQFHDFVPRAKERAQAIRQRLRATHEPSYQYEFIWESWARR